MRWHLEQEYIQDSSEILVILHVTFIFHCNCRSTSPASITDMVLDDKAAPAPSSSPASPRKLRLPFTSFPSSNSFSLAKAPSISIRQRSPSPGHQPRPALLGGRSCSFLASNARIEQVRTADRQDRGLLSTNLFQDTDRGSPVLVQCRWFDSPVPSFDNRKNSTEEEFKVRYDLTDNWWT